MAITYEIKLSDGETLGVDAETYDALASASFNSGEHARLIEVQPVPNGQGTAASPKIIVNVDHIVTARRRP
ncbi:MAG TPA: hypothetical protein VGN14_00875 [Candidatus Elarobacter sp.]|jgi:hypothetical protein